jgi:DNA-binding MarR family transcriptional regulator
MVKVRLSDWDILETIRRKQPISCTNLSEVMGLTRQGMHLRLKKLEKKGMVFQEPGAGRRPGLYYAKVTKPWEKISGTAI